MTIAVTQLIQNALVSSDVSSILMDVCRDERALMDEILFDSSLVSSASVANHSIRLGTPDSWKASSVWQS